jgi:hypothetical protein
VIPHLSPLDLFVAALIAAVIVGALLTDVARLRREHRRRLKAMRRTYGRKP